MGIGFTLALFVLGAVRELFGSGALLGFNLFGAAYPPFLLYILPPGAFITLGLLLALMNRLEALRK
jgi:electron transport complex protein RnfE